jgi:hypothetical protein
MPSGWRGDSLFLKHKEAPLPDARLLGYSMAVTLEEKLDLVELFLLPEGVIMALCGWKTRSVFDRYRIVNEADLADGLGKLAAAHEAPTEASGNVSAFRKVAR